MVVYYWGDACWCKECDMDSMMVHKGDDFNAIFFEEGMPDDLIDKFVREEVAIKGTL